MTENSAPNSSIVDARSADDLLTALFSIKSENRERALQIKSLSILRATADLCGQDAVDMTKRQAIRAIIENF